MMEKSQCRKGTLMEEKTELKKRAYDLMDSGLN
jgi:hypothetical protein